MTVTELKQALESMEKNGMGDRYVLISSGNPSRPYEYSIEDICTHQEKEEDVFLIEGNQIGYGKSQYDMMGWDY